MTTPGTESSYPGPPQSLNDSFGRPVDPATRGGSREETPHLVWPSGVSARPSLALDIPPLLEVMVSTAPSVQHSF